MMTNLALSNFRDILLDALIGSWVAKICIKYTALKRKYKKTNTQIQTHKYKHTNTNA